MDISKKNFAKIWNYYNKKAEKRGFAYSIEELLLIHKRRFGWLIFALINLQVVVFCIIWIIIKVS